MNLYLISFIALAFMVIVGGTYQLSNQTFGAILFFIGSLTLFIIYGIRWFGSTPMFTSASGPWPPVINTCPDYLTYYQRTVNGIKKDTCIDTIGVSNGLMPLFPKSGTPEDDNYYLDLSGMSSDPATKATQMCNKAMQLKLTWEGVTNGESCVQPVVPTSGGSGTAGGGSSGCPAK